MDDVRKSFAGVSTSAVSGPFVGFGLSIWDYPTFGPAKVQPSFHGIFRRRSVYRHRTSPTDHRSGDLSCRCALTTLGNLVGTARFELATPCTPNTRPLENDLQFDHLCGREWPPAARSFGSPRFLARQTGTAQSRDASPPRVRRSKTPCTADFSRRRGRPARDIGGQRVLDISAIRYPGL
jgi:hypothetical protein